MARKRTEPAKLGSKQQPLAPVDSRQGNLERDEDDQDLVEIDQAVNDDEDDELEEGEEEDDFDFDLAEPPLPAADYAQDLNDPRTIHLPDAPLIGGRGRTQVLGQEVETIGAASSPELWASSARSPDAVRLYVYKVDSTTGSPMSLGSIVANCTEESFIRHFYNSMPRVTEGPAQFQLRPANIHGKEVGAMVVRFISPHHTTLVQLREEEKAAMSGAPAPWQINSGDGGAGVVAAELGEQMGQISAQMMEYQERQLQLQQEAVEQARQEAREAERKSAEERIALAKDSTALQQTIMERMMAVERERTKETLSTQKDSSQFMLQLLTGMSSQTRESLIAENARQKEEEARRAEREREYFDRLFREDQARRERERLENEARWARDREAAREEQARREAELKAQIELAKLDLANREKAMLEEAARKERELEAKHRAAMEEREARDRREREEREARDRREREEREERARVERERFEREKAEERERREAREKREREEREERERREERAREKEREEARERLLRDEKTREAERLAAEARERILAEERRAAAERAQREHELALRRLTEEREATAARAEREAAIAREHAERLARIASEDRAAAQLSEERRLQAEREDAAARERDRERAHKAEMERLERQHQAAQAHEARMFDLQKLQATGGGNGLERLGDLAKTFGLEPTDALKKIFSADEGMTETVFKGLGALAEAYMRSQMGRAAPPVAVQQPAQSPQARQMVMIQTPEGPRQITVDAFRAMQAQAQLQASAQPPSLPGAPSLVPPLPPPLPPAPPEVSEPGRTSEPAHETAPETAPASSESPPAPVEPSADYLAAKEVQVLTRSREAGMSTKSARECRKFAKELLRKMSEADPATWSDILGPALMGRPDFLTYMESVTVWAAVVDAGAEPGFAQQVVDFIRAAEAELRSTFGQTEPMLPFNEADLVAFRARKPSPMQPALTSEDPT